MEQTRLQQWALVAEIVGGIAIVLSLVFVGYQIRENSRSEMRAMTQSLVSGYAQTVSLLAQHEDLRCAYALGMRDFDSLTGLEAAAFAGYMMAVWRSREDIYFQHLEGNS